MSWRPLLAFAAACLLGACAVSEYQYPTAWDPLPPAPAGCALLAGTYSDRGESGGQASEVPSLAYQLFGPNSPWEKAASVKLELPNAESLVVTVSDSGGPIVSRLLKASADEFACRNGHLVVRGQRWIATDLVMGRQGYVVDLAAAPKYLVAKVNEETYGTLFVVVPIAGTAQHWYRFARTGS